MCKSLSSNSLLLFLPPPFFFFLFFISFFFSSRYILDQFPTSANVSETYFTGYGLNASIKTSRPPRVSTTHACNFFVVFVTRIPRKTPPAGRSWYVSWGRSTGTRATTERGELGLRSALPNPSTVRRSPRAHSSVASDTRPGPSNRQTAAWNRTLDMSGRRQWRKA